MTASASCASAQPRITQLIASELGVKAAQVKRDPRASRPEATPAGAMALALAKLKR